LEKVIFNLGFLQQLMLE